MTADILLQLRENPFAGFPQAFWPTDEPALTLGLIIIGFSIGISLINLIASKVIQAMKEGLSPEELRRIEVDRAKHEEEPTKEFYIGHGYVMTDDGEIKPLDLFK